MRLYPVTLKKNYFQKQQILIIDSEWNMLKLLYALLSSEYDVIVKTSSVEALQWLTAGQGPALIITEINLPAVDGISFINHLKYSGLYKDIPVIILSDTGVNTSINTDLSFYSGEVIAKPFNPSFLTYKINSLINEHKSTMA